MNGNDQANAPTLGTKRGYTITVEWDWGRAQNKQLITKVVQAGYVVKQDPDKADQSEQAWHIHHHMAFHYWQSFSSSSTAISSDIRGVFHQVRLFPEDGCLLSKPGEDVRDTNARSFYVDNCLKNLPSSKLAKDLVDKLCNLLAAGAFELPQWASKNPAVISHLSPHTRSDNPQGKVEIAFLTARVVCSSHWSPVGKESFRFKVFGGRRVAEIQDLTGSDTWSYVPSSHNPADDITRGKSLCNLAGKDRWSQGPQFLRLPPAKWPEPPCLTRHWQDDEGRRSILCNLMTSVSLLTDRHEYQTLSEYLESTAQQHHGVADPSDCPTASEYAGAALDAIHQAQMDSFLSEVTHLKAGKRKLN
ncbi:hypothetical protein MHYP_G00053570 [Metynnis hypsauchen]